MENSDDISINTNPTQSGQVGIIRLLRKSQLNALTYEMISIIHEQLNQWEQDADIEAVIVSGDGDRAFCAGGDIRKIYDDMLAKRSETHQFFWREYRLNHYIANYQKPYIVLMDGITMGGGAGISVHGNFRIATENLTLAMPETGIGFFPDIGASYFLSRVPHNFGLLIGLAGSRLNAADAIYLGLADIYIPANRLDAVYTAICQTKFGDSIYDEVNDILNSFSEAPPESELIEIADEVENCFAKPTIEGILEELAKCPSAWAEKTRQALEKKSPLSLKVTLKQLRHGASKTLDTCLQMEYRLVNRFLKGHDFAEGVRAVIIDKDNNPNWQPHTLAEVTNEMVIDYFAPLDDQELHF